MKGVLVITNSKQPIYQTFNQDNEAVHNIKTNKMGFQILVLLFK